MPRPPAPEIDHPFVFSVSQIETFELCPRKWAFEKMDGVYVKPNKFAALGTEVHDVLEDFLSKGKPIDTDTVAGRIAKPGVKYLPFPKTPGMRVEKWFSIIFGVAAYRGLKDVEIIQANRARPLVLDHKTTRSWKWKKSKQELLSDTQAGIYAADAMQKTGAEEVDLRWVYYKTEGKPNSDPVDAVINREQVSRILTRTDQTARRIVQVLQTHKRALDVMPDFRGCSAYGGCPFRETHCKPKANQVLKAIVAQQLTKERRENKKSGSTTSDFLAEMSNRKKNKSGGGGERDPQPIEVDDVAQADPVNSPDREEFEQPAPPPAKKVNGKFVQPEWDDAAAEWKYPEGVEAEEKKEAAAKKAAEKAAGTKASTKSKGSKGGSSARDILAQAGRGKKNRTVERIEDPEGATEAAALDVAEQQEAVESSQEVAVAEGTLLDALLDLLADKIAERLRS